MDLIARASVAKKRAAKPKPSNTVKYEENMLEDLDKIDEEEPAAKNEDNEKVANPLMAGLLNNKI